MVAQATTWGREDDGQHVYDVHEGQADILRSDARFLAAIAGTGGGKTATGPIWCMREMQRVLADPARDITKDPIVGLAIAPTHPIKQRTTAREWVRMLKGTIFEGRYIESRNLYVLPNEWGVVWLLSADNPDGLEGGQADFAWMDEAGQMKYGAWVAIQGRLGLRYARALITTTPYSVNWLKYKFTDLARDGDKSYFVRQWWSIANPAYPRASYDDAKRVMSPQRFAMRYHGDMTKPAGLVYPDFDMCRSEFFLDELPTGLWYGGCDWGYHPRPFASVAAVRDENDVLWVFFLRYRMNIRIDVHAAAIPLGARYWVDPAEPEKADALRQAGHDVRLPPIRDRALGYDAVNRRIYDGRLKVHTSMGPLFSEAEEYQFPTADDEIVDGEPVGRHDALDAVRYMIVGLDARSIAVTEDRDAA